MNTTARCPLSFPNHSSLPALLLLLLLASAGNAATLTNLPTAISNTFRGMITLQVGGLTNGETILLEKFLDLNSNGVVNATDLLMQSFRVTDGVAPMIGGATNYSVPGDLTATNAAVTTWLNYYGRDPGHIAGRWLFRLSSPTGRFTPITNSFIITNTLFAQSITGQIRCGTTNMTNAIVVLIDASGDGNFQSGTVANSTGGYTIKAPPGAYRLFALKSGYVFDVMSAPVITLNSNATVTTNLSLLAATRTLAGRVVDAGNTNLSLPGMFLTAQSASGHFVIGACDSNGDFNLRVSAGDWTLEPEYSSVTPLGYIIDRTPPSFDTASENVTNALITLTKGTALFLGSIKTDTGTPIRGAQFWCDQDGDPRQFESGEILGDTNGNYAVAVPHGLTWRLQADADSPALANYVVTPGINTVISSNEAIRVDFTAIATTNRITGWVKDDSSNAVAGVKVYAYANIGGIIYNSPDVFTDVNGNFSLNVIAGTWHVQVQCYDDSGLLAQGYDCVGEQVVALPPTNATAYFIVHPPGPLEITTGSLPNGWAGAAYDAALSASGGVWPYTWTNAPGSQPLPAGLVLNPNGHISGTPTTAGTSSFTVRVTDSAMTEADTDLSITILPALTITTPSPLPPGTQGVFYTKQLGTSGGVPPCTWTNTSGSLPGGLTLSSSGLLSGTPATNGGFNFTVRASDSITNIASTNLALTIAASAVPDVFQYHVTKLKTFQQLDSSTLILNSNTGPFQCYVGLIQTAVGNVPIANVTLPSGGVRGLPLGDTGHELWSHENFTDEATFEATYPPGNYTFALYGLHDGLRYPVLNLPAAAYPVAPRISNFTAAQSIHPAGPFTLQWDTLAGGTADDPLWLVIFDTDGTNVFSTPSPATNFAGALKATATSVLIPTNTFQLNHTYLGSLTFFKATSMNTSAYPGALGSTEMGAQTWFPLATPLPVPTLTDPVRINPNIFRFTVNGLAGQNYTIQVSSNLVNWNSIRTTNAPADVFVIQLNLATNNHSLYRLKVEP